MWAFKMYFVLSATLFISYGCVEKSADTQGLIFCLFGVVLFWFTLKLDELGGYNV